jgi:hypothetical protein
VFTFRCRKSCVVSVYLGATEVIGDDNLTEGFKTNANGLIPRSFRFDAADGSPVEFLMGRVVLTRDNLEALEAQLSAIEIHPHLQSIRSHSYISFLSFSSDPPRAKILRHKIQLDESPYELSETFGGDSECVICLTEPRSRLLLP